MRPHHVYTDNSRGLKKAFEEKGWAADTSVPHRSETNGQAESAVRKVKEGTSSALVQSGFLESWWSEAMACYWFLRTVYDKLENHKTPYEIRFGEPGPIIPFGAEMSYKSISDKDKARLPSFGAGLLSGIFVGYKQHAGGGWTGDLLVADWDEIENAQTPSQVHVKTFKAGEVFPMTLESGNFIFPMFEGALKKTRSCS